jgi:hypothetical protein
MATVPFYPTHQSPQIGDRVACTIGAIYETSNYHGMMILPCNTRVPGGYEYPPSTSSSTYASPAAENALFPDFSHCGA